MRTLVLGGTRSGKSAHAEALLAGNDRIRYLATGAVPDESDPSWSERVQAHRDRRGDAYRTVETTDLAGALGDDSQTPTLIDDLGNWVTALADESGAWDDAAVDLSGPIADLCAAITAFGGDLVIVSPEVGLSVVPATDAGRRFQDLLGRVNTAVSAVCESVELVVAGRVMARSTETPASEPSVSDTPTPVAPVVAAAVPAAVAPIDAPAPGTVAAELDPTDAEVFDAVDLPDPSVADEARDRQLTLTKPPNALGRLEDLGVWISSCQGQCPPHRIANPQIVVFAGDHGVARDAVSAFPPEVTAQMVANIDSGGAAINVLARRAGAGVQVFDLSVDIDPDAGLYADHISRFKVSRSTGDLRRGEAMTLSEARRSVAAGRAIADGLVDSGADLLIAGDMGIGNTTPAAVLTGVLTDKEPVTVVGRGTGIDDNTWIRKTAAIRDGMRFGRPHRHDPLSLLAAVAGPDLAAMAGFLAQAALRKTPVILDGMVVTSAALVASRLAPGASAWWVAGHRSTEPAHDFALAELGLEPIVDLGMHLGEGSGAAVALPVVAAAVDCLTDMATFGDAGVDDGH